MAANTIGNPRKGSLCWDALVVVATVTVTGVEPEVEGTATEPGLIVQVVPAGAPEHAKVTVPLNVPTEPSPRL